jgi:DNA mismatch endonuclease (patch repair protein)
MVDLILIRLELAVTLIMRAKKSIVRQEPVKMLIEPQEVTQPSARRDPLDADTRSPHMSKIKGKGNKSTEILVEAVLIESSLGGWVKHPKEIVGRPDFFFPSQKLVLFVDGCFWHSCPVCNRRVPSNREDFWRQKLDQNRRRDNRQHRQLRRQGYHVMRIWEHELKKPSWFKRLRSMLRRLEDTGSQLPPR